MKSLERVLRCDCGFEARAEHEDELVAGIQRHAWEAHAMALSQDEVLLLASRAELGEKAPSTIPRETDSAEHVAAAFERAGLEADRIVEAVGLQARTAIDNQRRKT